MGWICLAALALGACFGASSDGAHAGQGGQGGVQAGAGGSGPFDASRCDGIDCGYSEPCPGGFRNEPGSCCPVCVTDGAPVADPVNPTPPLPDDHPTPMAPAPACAASVPADGAACDVDADAACSDGGFGCSCQCECYSNQGGAGSGTTCVEPCAWRCSFQDQAFVSLDAASVNVDCSTSPATLTATVDLTFHAPATGPAMVFELQPLRVQMEKGAEGFSCDAPDVPTPAAIGPLAPGSAQSQTYTIGPLPCGDPSSANPRFDTCTFGYCASPGEAWIMVGAKATGGSHESSANVNLQELPGGERIAVNCSGGI